ncbi:MAG: sigma-54-dependent transcriptional regulator [Planctomycetota bacterium]|jgi:DNA-binding NtrC family response regulator
MRTAKTDLADLRVLVVDDEPDMRLGLRRLIGSLGCDVQVAEDGEAALRALAEQPVDVVLSDVRMPRVTGPELLKQVLARWPQTAVVILTGYATVELAVSCVKAGAAHFLAKPFDNKEVLTLVERLGRHALSARFGAAERRSGSDFIAVAPIMQDVLAMVDRVGPSPLPVLIEGASGTGKELVAQLVHARSAVSQKPFLAVNTAALPDTLLESELFGHKRGAYTGATDDHLGIFERAAGGTVFLDEVASMSLSFQAKLLRVLESKIIRPLGGSEDVPVAFRLIAASNQDLGQLVVRGKFREDLYYRLRVVSIRLPELRQRVADIPPLAAHFLRKAARVCLGDATAAPLLSAAALDELCACRWPGNVRQLENTIQRAVVVCRGPRILPHHLGLSRAGWEPGSEEARSYDSEKKAAIERFQREFIHRALESSEGNVSRAAQCCGLTRAAFQKIMRSLSIDRADFQTP